MKCQESTYMSNGDNNNDYKRAQPDASNSKFGKEAPHGATTNARKLREIRL